jgi:hypothetical protein
MKMNKIKNDKSFCVTIAIEEPKRSKCGTRYAFVSI